MPSLIRRRLADESGFTMVIALGVLLVVMGFSVAALDASTGETHMSARNQDDKAAYAAAEAGVNAYLAQLNGNPSYWTSCDQPPGITPPGVAPEWQPVASGASAQYTVELLPGNGPCSTTNPDTTMINSDGTLRVRVTGEAHVDTPGHPTAKRTIVLTMRRDGFLDFLLWTDYESLDPNVTASVWNCDPARVWKTSPGTAGEPVGQAACYQTRGASGAATPTLGDWTNTNCNVYWRNGRNAGATFPGEIYHWDATNKVMRWDPYTTWFRTYDATFAGLPCEEASFGSSDAVAGQLHTNDRLRICGSSISFGRNSSDRIEVEDGTASAWMQDPTTGCSGAVQPSPGAWTPGAAHMERPPQAQLSSLKNIAANSFDGGTTIAFGTPSASQMQVTNNGSTQTLNQPSDGVIYVGSKVGCSGNYNPMFPFVPTGAASELCGDVAIQGQYNKNITVVAERDIVITDDLTRDPDSSGMLGLIGGQYVRIDHPSTLFSGNGPLKPWPNCSDTSTATYDLNLDAAILAVNGSFLLDRYGCGSPRGNLNLTGAIAQAHRGSVGVSGGTSAGYVKNYVYDDRLKSRTPPYFLDPVNSSWHVVRQVEQTPPSYDCTQSPLPPGC